MLKELSCQLPIQRAAEVMISWIHFEISMEWRSWTAIADHELTMLGQTSQTLKLNIHVKCPAKCFTDSADGTLTADDDIVTANAEMMTANDNITTANDGMVVVAALRGRMAFECACSLMPLNCETPKRF